jgi:hypothetical protein
MKEKLCSVFDLLGMMYAVMLNCRMHFISSGKKWVPIETWSNKKAEKNSDGLCPKPITDHHKHPRLAKAGNGRKPRWVLPKPITESQQTPKAGTQRKQRWVVPKPITKSQQIPKAGDSKKTETGGAGMHLAITTPTALFGTKEGVVVPIEEEMKEGGLHQTSFPAQKRRRGRRRKKQEGRKLKKTQRHRGKERFVWMNA